jgi:hypothetical protein
MGGSREQSLQIYYIPFPATQHTTHEKHKPFCTHTEYYIARCKEMKLSNGDESMLENWIIKQVRISIGKIPSKFLFHIYFNA